MNLSDEVLSIKLKSGKYQYIDRAGWALTYLKQSGLIESPRRAVYKINNEGLELFKKGLKKIEEKDLEIYPKYQDFCKRSSRKKDNEPGDDVVGLGYLTPEDMIDEALNKIKTKVCDDLLEKVRGMDPTEFEKTVITLMLALGYGDGSSGSSIHTGKPSDGGIDGIINQDKLGLDTISIQAKRYKEDSKIDVGTIRSFVGALQGKESKGSRKGIFITTSDFTRAAREFIDGINNPKVVLINGEQLVELMYDNEVGVTVDRKFRICKLDTDFFED